MTHEQLREELDILVCAYMLSSRGPKMGTALLDQIMQLIAQHEEGIRQCPDMGCENCEALRDLTKDSKEGDK